MRVSVLLRGRIDADAMQVAGIAAGAITDATGILVVGRDPDATLTVDDERVSWHAVRIRGTAAEIVNRGGALVHRSGKPATMVAAGRTDEITLVHRTVIELAGGSGVLVVIDDPSQLPGPPAPVSAPATRPTLVTAMSLPDALEARLLARDRLCTTAILSDWAAPRGPYPVPTNPTHAVAVLAKCAPEFFTGVAPERYTTKAYSEYVKDLIARIAIAEDDAAVPYPFRLADYVERAAVNNHPVSSALAAWAVQHQVVDVLVDDELALRAQRVRAEREEEVADARHRGGSRGEVV